MANQMSECQDKFFDGEAQLLQLVLERLESADVLYCIERNYQEYPNIITGDVDFLVLGGDLGAAVRETLYAAKRLNWSPFVVYVGSHAAHIGFYADKWPSRFVLVIEFFVGGVWRGLQFLCPERAIRMRQRHGCTWKPNPAHEAIITLIHHLLYNRRVYEKYRSRIKALVDESLATFEQELGYALGSKTARAFTRLVLAEDWDGLESQARNLRCKFLIRSFTSRPLRSAAAVCRVCVDTSKKPDGVVISLDSIRRNSPEILADELIELAVRWHIFVPPNKKKIVFPSKNATKLIKSTVVSGGVAVVLNPPGEKLRIPLRFPIVHVEEQGDTLSVRIGSEPMQRVQGNAAPLEIWNVVLQYRSKALSSLT